MQEALDPFARTAAILGELLPGELGRQWLTTPHPHLEDRRTPLQALLGGHGERVARTLEIAREGSGIGQDTVHLDYHQISSRAKPLSAGAVEFTTSLKSYVSRWAGRSGVL